jgi:hypothetical protein
MLRQLRRVDDIAITQDWANPILQQPYEVKDGKLHIPECHLPA